MGISDAEVWDYSTAIRDVIKAKELHHVKALRIVDLLDHPNTENLTRDEYLDHAGCYRRELIAKYSPVDFDAREAIKKETDICMTYRGYIKFLTKDLKYSRVAEETQSQENPKKRYKEAIENLALKMIVRGKVSLMSNSDQGTELTRGIFRLLPLPLRECAGITCVFRYIHQLGKQSSLFLSFPRWTAQL